jgi:hypothetical protein
MGTTFLLFDFYFFFIITLLYFLELRTGATGFDDLRQNPCHLIQIHESTFSKDFSSFPENQDGGDGKDQKLAADFRMLFGLDDHQVVILPSWASPISKRAF